MGLYRLCGSAAVKKELRDAFEQDSAAVCLSEDVYPDINVITGQRGTSPLPAHSFHCHLRTSREARVKPRLSWPFQFSFLIRALFPLPLAAPGTPLASEAGCFNQTPLSTGILKDYLRELPTPLITQPLYQVVLEAMAQGHPSRASLGPEGTRGLLSCLPDVERVSWPC